ncbi:MAG: response regulator transcription factor [Bacilli bacterium]|nr:response regulator transcription factor [Bacilli bacterium]
MTNNVKPTIYFVEDDPSIFDLIEETLDVNDFNSQGFEEPLKMLQVIQKQKPDLIVLDLMLPHMSGYDVIEILQNKKEYNAIPIIIVSAKSAESDIVKGLDMGASDYITKPFGIREFVSRIKTNLRKVPKVDNGNVITIRDLSLDDDKHRCTFKENVLELTLTEYSLLKQLMENVGRVQTRTKLLNIIWGYSHQAETRTLDMHVRSIREKLSHYTDEQYIETIRGVGYIINE